MNKLSQTERDLGGAESGADIITQHWTGIETHIDTRVWHARTYIR
jgi:hypothetical protein